MSGKPSFSDHINAQVNKANKMLGFICRTISGSKILLPTLRSLYVTLVRSHIEYASEIWSLKSVTMLKRIERVQRRATRLMLPGFSYNERLKRLNLLPLVCRREVKDLPTFYKLTNCPPGKLPKDRSEGTAAFQVVGVDFAGPPRYRKGKKNEGKACIVLYACSLTRGIYVELLPSMETMEFMNSLKRFIARRGRPDILFRQ